MNRRALTLSILVLVAACAPDQLDPVTPPPPPVTPPPPPTPTSVRWSDPATWLPGTPPAAGASVEIPVGKTVELDVSPPALGALQVNGTLTVVPDRQIELRASSIAVAGTFRAGTEETPYAGRLIITLTGGEAPDLPPVGAKAFAVYPGGVLELHGQRRVSWTRLINTAQPGSAVLTLEDAVDWVAGDRVVIASTDFDPNHAETMAVQAAAGNIVTLDRSFAWRHWGTPQVIGGRTVDQRAEVGLLSRNITVRSDSFGEKGFGGHVIALAGGIMRIENAEFHRMGQRGRLARYTLHWHMAGDVSGQYVRNSAIWQSNNRCLTIHGTDNAAVANNVCYDHLGHGYFLEDGAESGNRLEGNLGLVSRIPDAPFRLLPSDATPATFWLTNPANTVNRNVSAGSVGFGFWYALPAEPTGLSTGQPDRPRLTPLGHFRDNVAHSNKRPGLNVDDGPKPDGTTETNSYTPKAGASASGTPVVAVFENFIGWKHSGRAIWLRGNSQKVTGAVLSDNLQGGTFAASSTTLENSLVVGESDNVTPSPNASYPIRGFEFYDGTVGSAGVTFANFVSRAGRPASAFGYNRANGWPTAADNFAQGTTLVAANAIYLETPSATKDGDKSGIIRDLDGSLTGQAGLTVVPDLAFLRTAACQQRTDWNAWICPHRYVTLQIVSESGEPIAPTVLRREDGIAVRLVGIPSGPVSASMTLMPNQNYLVEPEVSAAARIRFTMQRPLVGDWIRVSVPFEGSAVGVYRDYATTSLTAAASVAEIDASTGDRYYWDTVNRRIVVKMLVRTGRTSTTVQIQRR